MISVFDPKRKKENENIEEELYRKPVHWCNEVKLKESETKKPKINEDLLGKRKNITDKRKFRCTVPLSIKAVRNVGL